ncbi:RNA-directed DNA polymerase, eukaryota [Tanacetum coccineum]
MLCKPKPYYDELNKVAIGYKNPLCLTRAKQVQPALYNGHKIIKTNHVPALVHNSEDTVEIAEITRKKMNDKIKNPECVQKKVKITPLDYSKENYLATFTPQKQLTPKQIFWSQDLIKMKAEALKTQTTASRPIKVLMVYPPNTPATLVPRVLPTKTDRTLDFRTLDFQITQLTKKINVLQEQNELFRVENGKIKQHYKELYDSIKITRAKHLEQTTALLIENESLKVQIHNKLSCVNKDHVKPKVLAPGKYAIDVEPIPPRNRNNREVHLVYLKHLKESVETLREIVEEAKVERPLDSSLASACRYTKHSQELLEYVIGTYQKKKRGGCVKDLKDKLSDIDSILDKGGVNDDILLARTNYMNLLLDAKAADTRDYIQKAKIQWAVEGDENSKFFHGIVNRKRANLTVKGIMVDGVWVDEPSRVKKEFRDHFAARFQDPGICHGKLNFSFPNRLSSEQVAELEIPISKEEIRNAVWGCGENKSPGPDGFTFEFFRKYWHIVGTDFCLAVEWFFNHDSFSVGCNSSFIALIPKSLDPKLVSDFRPIIVHSPNRQILDGPFILNDLLARCHFKKQSAMVFKVDFAKAYDSIRWDYLEDVLHSFGFGVKWRSWIKGCLSSSMASILVNGSPTSEFQFHRGLKQGDPFGPLLFHSYYGNLTSFVLAEF